MFPMRIAATSAGGGGLFVLAVGFWLSAMPAESNAQFFNITPVPRPPSDVPGGTPGPAQSLAPPTGPAATPSAPAPKGPMLQSLPPAGNTPAATNPAPSATSGQAALALSAKFGRDMPAITGGLHWRIYSAKIEQGALRPVKEEKNASPTVTLPAGAYVVHVGFGLASAPKTIQLPEGTYHIVSNYGDVNATVRSDIRVQAGKLTDATVTHRAAIMTLKLVNEWGGEARANTQWSVLTPGGDVIKESIGAFPRVILAEGEYRVIARNDNLTYERAFKVITGVDSEVEVLARR